MPIAATPLLNVANVKRSMAFYRCLGFGVVAQTIDDFSDEPVWTMLESLPETENETETQPKSHADTSLREPVRLMLAVHGGVSHEERQMRPSFSGMVWFLECDDVGALYDVLVAQGYAPEPVVTLEEDGKGQDRGQFFVRDPDGYEIAITGPDRRGLTP